MELAHYAEKLGDTQHYVCFFVFVYVFFFGFFAFFQFYPVVSHNGKVHFFCWQSIGLD